MSLLTLPTEILHDILHRLPPNWESGRPEKPRQRRQVPTRTDLFWFLNLRLVGKRIDDVVIDHFLAAIQAGKVGRKLAIRRGPPTPSTIAIGARLLKSIVQNYRSGLPKSPYGFVNTVIQGVEGAVRVFSGSNDNDSPDKLQSDYTDALSSTLVAHLGTDLIIMILSGESDLDDLDEETDEWRAAALMAAAYLGRIDHMEKLIALGADINYDPEDKWVYPPLMAASFAGRMDVLKFLAERGVGLDARTVGNGENAIHFAVLGGHVEVVQFLIDNSAGAGAVNNDGDTPLLWAVGGGHAAIVKVLVAQHDVDVNMKDRLGRAPLIWAVERGYTNDVFLELFEGRNLDFDTVDEDDTSIDEVTPLAMATAMGREFIFQVLILQGHVNMDVLYDAFSRALLGRSVCIVATIYDLNHTVSTSYMVREQEPPLLTVAHKGTEEMLRYLISRDDTPINCNNEQGDTPLRAAIDSRDIGKVKAILEHPELKVNQVNTCSVIGRGTVLNYAACFFREDVEIIKALLAHPDIDVNARDDYEMTPLAQAARNGHVETLKLLLARDDVDKRPLDKSDTPPLLLAVESGETAIVDILN
ncbi:ankyrin repeat-containing domain protein [Aspergillus cavernicola]|uniref:Ankyrin repeat-containing domain protein n=1 Tax=Aspergillus cavernicola TaxID=176166 RepID=A0ABR4J1B4_9EURO